MSSRAVRRGVLAVPLVIAVLATLGCATSGEAPTPSPVAADPFAPFHQQDIAWSDCGEGVECASVTAPLDWKHPGDGRTIEVAVVRHPASGDRLGTLFMNPGGPGISGVDDLRRNWETTFSPRLVERFDLVAWDSRGVGGTTPVVCYTDPVDVQEWLYGITEPSWLTDPDGWARAEQAAGRDYAAACAAGTGEALEFVDSGSTIRDLELLRVLLGDEPLNFLGYSHGTLLGQRYLGEFPERVGRMVLDGVTDPARSTFEHDLAQDAAFHGSLTRFARQCDERFGADCPLPREEAAALAAVHDLLLRVEAHPVPASDPADGRRLGAHTLRDAIIEALYSESSWDDLARALRELWADPPRADAAFALADAYFGFVPGRAEAGAFDTAFDAIRCADREVARDLDTIRAQAAAFAEAAPVLTLPTPPLVDTVCGNWRYPPKAGPSEPIRGIGAPPILLLSSTGDAATPYESGVRVAERLESGVLVTVHAERHTAYRAAADACVRDTVDDYFIHGDVPRADPHCGR